MIRVYHKNNIVIDVENIDKNLLNQYLNKYISQIIFKLSSQFPDEIIVWCHCDFKEVLNITEIPNLVIHNKLLLSYNPTNDYCISDKIGYVDQSLFLRCNKNVTFPTWKMSGNVGCVHAEVLNAISAKVVKDKDFDYFLTSIAKLYLSKGLFCYSEPKLLINNKQIYNQKKTNNFDFKFVKQHYKTRWIFLLFLNILIYEHKLLLFSFFSSFFYKNRTNFVADISKVELVSNSEINDAPLDIIIPTIGRKKYLFDFLNDLKAQTKIPKNVIIVEQNPIPNTASELSFIKTETWPFKIKHTFTNKTGACNARNIALKQIESEWVFLADDDIRIEKDFVEKVFVSLVKTATKAVSINCLLENQKTQFHDIMQWITFGSGCSFVKTDVLKDCQFNTAYEFGFGEDGDFGMQIRNTGVDVLYFPSPIITHIKAPIGGFRTPIQQQWYNEKYQPKPSPSIMLFVNTHNTIEQKRGYKTLLFFKYYKLQKTKNPFLYYSNFQKQWEVSNFWAKKMQNNSKNLA